MSLTAFALNCSLKSSPGESSTDKLLREVLAELAAHDVKSSGVVRIADYHVLPGVSSDEGVGDDWPEIRRQILDADIFVFGTPIWMGHPCSNAQRVLERLDAFLGETDDDGRMISLDRVALVAVVGNEDGAHHVAAELFQGLSDVGFTVPANGMTYWVGEAMHKTDYKDLPAEALNEHILGHRWPRPSTRRKMLEEAVVVIRELCTGATVDHRGDFYEVENARLFDAPEDAIPIIVSGFGPEAAKLAGRIGDGFWGNAPDRALLDAFESTGGNGSRYAQLNLCWADDPDDARKTAYRIWPNAGIPGQLSQDLPTWTHFEEAAEIVTEDVATKSIPCGPDIASDLVETVREYVEAGYDHLYFHQVGPDQDGFFQFWARELGPALRSAL